MRVVIDIETRSACDLRKAGVYAYAEHPTTEITHFGYKVGDAPTCMWTPLLGEPMPVDLYMALADTTVTLVAHNYDFERLLLTGYPGRKIGVLTDALADLNRWDCTAARAAHMGLPRTLDGACAALDLPVQKDREGHALMLRCCKPRKPRKDEDPTATLWHETPEQIARMGLYCAQDCEAEYALDKTLPPLPPFERDVWQLTSRMNDRGILVDAQLLIDLAFLVEAAERDVNSALHAATGGAAKRVSDHGAITRWLRSLGADDDLGDDGIGKAALTAMLEREDLPDLVRSVLMLRREGGKSSASKFKAILARLSRDGRLRGSMVYCGAAATKRWCLAEGSAVLVRTSAGTVLEKPIETVSRDDRVWDGDHWVTHGGVVFSGEKDVIEHDGVVATADHKAYIEDDQATTLGDAAARGLRLFKGNINPWP